VNLVYTLSRVTTTDEIFAGRAEDPYTLAVRAYVWGYPLVSSAGLRQALTSPLDPFVRRPPTSPGAALNHLGLQAQLSDPRTLGVGVNVDTLYALAWLDLADTPFVLETPDFGRRYYTFQMAQADTSAEASFGQRTHGSRLPPLFIHGPGHEGIAPAGTVGVRSFNRYFLVAGRILVDPATPGDFDTVRALQRQIQLRPAQGQAAASDPPPQRPLLDANRRIDPALAFLEQLGNVLRDFDPARGSEADLVGSLAGIGLTRRSGFDPGPLSAEATAELVRGLRDAAAIVRAKSLNLGVNVNGWTINYQGPRFGTDWLLRAGVVLDQRNVTVPEEALYPLGRVDGDGAALDGANAYRIRFAPGQLPPVGGFWSITIYDDAGRLVANPIHRYAIGDRTPGLASGEDGALDIAIQHAQPASGPSNWLPAPAGRFYLMLRLYIPAPRVLDGTWKPPAIERLPRSGAD
jgi:hypothetical protein